MTYLNTMIQRISESAALSGFEILSAETSEIIQFPLIKPTILLAEETTETLLPIGSNDCAFISENIKASILTPEKDGGAFCKEAAETTAWTMLAADSEKRIVGLSMQKCSFDEKLLCWKIIITIELSLVYIHNGEE